MKSSSMKFRWEKMWICATSMLVITLITVVDCFLIKQPQSNRCRDFRLLFSNTIEMGSQVSIPILYESDNVLAINKPPHVPHHNSEEEIGIMSHIRILQDKNVFPYKGRIYSVHRLDRCTSGVLLFAKNKETAKSLSQSFREKEVTKYYVALTGKKPKKKKQGWVKGGMSPSRRGTWKLSEENGKNQAVTRFYSGGLGSCDLQTFDQDLVEDAQLRSKTLVLFEPHTGKTHQLRVAAKSLGMPILGDKMYGDAVDAERFKRTYLHSLAIDVHINDDEHVTIFNPPDWFISALSNNDCSLPCAESVMVNLLNKHCKNEYILTEISRYNNASR